jgi:cytoplasmic iron level regulating protein YaaA (DUF328/UPF0246 family)
VILLPPSEGKAPGGAGDPWAVATHEFPGLHADRAAVRDAVRGALEGGDAVAARLFGVGGRHLAQALGEWEELDEAPTMAAARRYSGVVWGALAPDTLDRASRRRMDTRVLVPSGLWGLLAATDPIPAYRLRMGSRVPPVGSLAAFWRPRITPLIDRRAAGGWVIDLLPDEHAAAIDAGLLASSRLLRVVLVEGGGPGAPRAMGHAGKSMKGLLARAILEADARSPRAVAELEVPGLVIERVDVHRDGATVVFAGVSEEASRA